MITDDQIETAARAICVELGVDPDGEIWHAGSDPKVMTPAELVVHEESGGMTFDVAIRGERWMLYRHAAAVAIAARRVGA